MSVRQIASHEMALRLLEQDDFGCDPSAAGKPDRFLLRDTIDPQHSRVVTSDPDHILGVIGIDQVAGVREPTRQITHNQLMRSCKFRDLRNNAVENGRVRWKHHRQGC